MQQVQRSRELDRILALPRRLWADEGFAAELTQCLKRPGGTMTLLPIQAQALCELIASDGLVAPIRVGGGKTLITLLAPFVVRAKRPLLVTRASLLEKTRRDIVALSNHWQIPKWIRVVSYELLGLVQHAQLLFRYLPDLVICDEAHCVRNLRASRTRRLARYLTAHPNTKFVALSGTLVARSLHDYAHYFTWALRDRSPVPSTWSDLEAWSEAAFSVRKEYQPRRLGLGALEVFGGSVEAAQAGFQQRLVDTQGVVTTQDAGISASLTIHRVRFEVPPQITRALADLRDTWVTLDGWPLSDPMAVTRHLRELVLGFYYVWDPRPPPAWLLPRREWAATCRHILESNRRDLDSELAVTQAVDAGHYPAASGALTAWRAVRPTFEAHVRPVWLDTYAVEWCAKWLLEAGICWTEQSAFARKLEEVSGVPYFGPQGRDARGRYVESMQGASIIASIKANSEGKNLQAWNRNLVSSCPSTGECWEQLLGRTHRFGQEADEVTCDLLLLSAEQERAWEQARSDARFQQQSTGQTQKLEYGDMT